jgi:hypothetical protein
MSGWTVIAGLFFVLFAFDRIFRSVIEPLITETRALRLVLEHRLSELSTDLDGYNRRALEQAEKTNRLLTPIATAYFDAEAFRLIGEIAKGAPPEASKG